MKNIPENKILIFNHVFWPDQHNTARHISELSSELVIRGWDVTAIIGNRSYLDHRKKYLPRKGIWMGVKYKRIYLPPLNQKKNIQRLVTSLWLVFNWIIRIPWIGDYNLIIVGTNPPFAYLVLPFLKLFKRKSKLVLWGFDLYPEAIMASGKTFELFVGKIIKPVTKHCHRCLDIIVDIGNCMRTIYRSYGHRAQEATLTPWSFLEPSHKRTTNNATRRLLFGDAKVALLYSGTLGYAHEFDNFLLLARQLQKIKAPVSICFAGFGNRFEELKQQMTPRDYNINFANFVMSDDELSDRLSTADFMLISLKESWTGISVPSKFFGAIASGKAVLFSGSEHSSICELTEKYKLGFHLTKNNVVKIAESLSEIAANPELLIQFQNNAFNTYNKYFSKKTICDGWDKLLRDAIQS